MNWFKFFILILQCHAPCFVMAQTVGGDKPADTIYYSYALDSLRGRIVETQISVDSTILQVSSYDVKSGLREGVTFLYYKSGALKERSNFHNDSLSGRLTSYYENGNIESLGSYSGGLKEGEWEWYYSNGAIRLRALAIKGLMNGEVTAWYSNGKIKSEGYYIDGLPDGTWKYWNEDGVLVLMIETKLGVNEGRYVEYYLNGVISLEGSFKNGKRVGVFNYYNEEGDLIRSENMGQ